LVEDWESIEAHTRRLESNARVGSYQMKEVKGGTEIRVRVGQFGYVKLFKDPDDPKLIQIEAFCKIEGFYKIQGSQSDEFFYA